MNYIDIINSPEDLKKLDIKELPALAAEIRQFLISSVSKTGGHLASNLGVVELTIALHYCFGEKDKIIWDVGHQSYTHKILTGRKEGFSSLRKEGGLSGFPKSEESPYDAFNTGHSSTSVSAAMGMAAARDLNGDNYNIAAVIGDGSMTGGLFYEALNNLGRSKMKMLIILNDNQMSISKNVGSMSKYLSSLRTAPKYIEAKNEVQNFFGGVPVVGKSVNKVLEKTKGTLKYMFFPNSMFEQLGIKYFGPIDGHDIARLIDVIRGLEKINRPVILHVITKKGKGYSYAEKNPGKFHGVGCFDIKTGESTQKKYETYSELFGKNMARLAARNKKVAAITAAMPTGTGLDFFKKTYPERFFDVGIAEEHAVTFAAGLAKNGYIPVFGVYSTFLQRAYDQILHDVCLQKLHVVFAIDRAGIVGNDGETHQGIFDLSYLSHIPEMTVMAPKNENEFEAMLNFAVNEYDKPIAIRYPKGKASKCLNNACSPIVYGRSEYIKKGERAALISVGCMAESCIEACKMLEKDGINVTLINARFVSPVDIDMLKEVSLNHSHIFVAEDNIIRGGYCSSVMQTLSENDIFDLRIKGIAFPAKFIEQGSREELFRKYSLDSNGIYSKIKSILKKQESRL